MSVQKKKKTWIQKAIKHPGALHDMLHIPQGQKIPAKLLASAANKPGLLGKRARFAQYLISMRSKKSNK